MMSTTSRVSLVETTIDPQLLPSRVLIDTGVLIRALGQRPKDPRSKPCRSFFEAMIHVKGQMLISAVSIAEMIRKDPSSSSAIPRTKSIMVVAFDARAGQILGERFPMATLVEARGPGGTLLDYFHYDALIVACAIRHGAHSIVSLDGGMAKLGAKVGIKVEEPDAFLHRQRALFPLGPQVQGAKPGFAELTNLTPPAPGQAPPSSSFPPPHRP